GYCRPKEGPPLFLGSLHDTILPMALNYYEPQAVGAASQESFQITPYLVLPNVPFRRGDLMKSSTTGVFVTPPANGTGALAGVAGPAASAITLGSAASAGAPAGTTYVIVTYAASTAESLPSQEYIVNAAVNTVATVNVAAAGAPAGATSYNVYASFVPGYEAKQNAAIVALGTATTLTYPLANYAGLQEAGTGAVAGIVGMALADSNAMFWQSPGAVGNTSAFGVFVSVNRLQTTDAYLQYVMKLQGVSLEMSLSNSVTLSPALVGTSTGITYDPTSNFYIADPSQAAAGVIQAVAQGPSQYTGSLGGGGGRVVVLFNPGALA
ncbi:MAG: hypothetical protein ACREQ5_13815, partial [Candidatus Dormibacteria bacterium]